jgi:phosphomannomutase
LTRKFVFDVDGTLTPSRQKIDPIFAEFFLDFCNREKVYLVTGSDRKKTEEQLTPQILDNVQILFNCAANEAWKGTELLYRNTWEPKPEFIDFLNNELNNSKFAIKTGLHIEKRTGLVNFSIVGRNCTLEERKEYVYWDKETNERELILERIQNHFPELDIFVGGETGLDIVENGLGKIQCLKHIRENDEDFIYYYGDQIFPGGNDYEVALACNEYNLVNSWENTHKNLIYFMEDL